MAWDLVATNTKVNQNYQTIQQNLEALPYYQELKSRGIQSGPDNMNSSQSAISGARDDIKAELNNRKMMIQTIVNSADQATVAALNAQISALKPTVEQQKTIFQLRTEQAASLANKYEGGWNAQWWELWFPFGLQKPLSSTTRTLLYVAATGLVGTAVYAAIGNKGTPTVVAQAGGRRKKRGLE
jgi:hypothetical protein